MMEHRQGHMILQGHTRLRESLCYMKAQPQKNIVVSSAMEHIHGHIMLMALS
jgi:hypothetical protein